MIRILSDLHVYDARTQVRALAQLEPLLAGVRTLVLNGDTCETRRGVTDAQLTELKAFFRARVPEVIILTGNHDPAISSTHELLLADGRVWVMHGDVCFDDFTPWSRQAPEVRRLVAAKRAADPTQDFSQLAVRFRIAREVALEETELPDRTMRTWRAHLAWAWHTFFPPRQPLAMLRSWREMPRLAAGLAVAQRPTTQVVVSGHIHFPGVWRPAGGPVVINTGSFSRPLGGSLADVLGDRVQVRRIVRDGDSFKPGRLLEEILLRPAKPASAPKA